jgi:hypothetical protein
MVSGRLAPGMGITTGALASSQARATRWGETPWASATSAKARWRPPRSRPRADPPERAPGQEGDPLGGAEGQLALGAAEAGGELVLDAGHLHQLAGLVDLVDADVGEADQPDLAGRLELGQRPHRLGEGHLGVGAVELVQADGVDAEGAQAGLAGLAEVFGPPVQAPLAAGPGVAALGGHQHPVAVARPAGQGLGDQALAMAEVGLVAAVGVGRVDQGHAGVQGGVDGPDRAGLVGPAGQRHRHLAEPDGADLEPAETAGGQGGHRWVAPSWPRCSGCSSWKVECSMSK